MRPSVPAALAALLLGLSVVLAGGGPALADGVFVETNPSTVPAGDEVGVRAGCDDNLKAATVTSTLFGTVQVRPQFGFLTATVRISAAAAAGDYRITLRCPGGRSSATTLHVVAKLRPSRGPATGGGGTRPGRNAPVLLAGGGVVLAAGLALGVLTLRRRRLG